MINFDEIAAQLKKQTSHLGIDKKELEDALEILINCILFPICKDETSSSQKIENVYHILLTNLSALTSKKNAESIVDTFVMKLPNLQAKLSIEASVFYKNDPAANSVEEVIIAYPGFFALVVHRLAHELVKLNAPIIPRLFSEYAHSKVGVDINPAAQIGDSFYIDHGTGIVIGETTIIGNNVKIYQGVTLGALFVTKELSNKKRHPTIENNVVIYAGATILGGETLIGHDSVIGGNVWLTHSVPAHSQVVHNAEIKIKNKLDRK